MGRIALKRLTASDLTFFEWHFRNRNAGNQKSINLNADVFVKELYPSVASIAASMRNEIPVALTLYGPGGKDAYRVARKIVKGGSYKNWRLNGEFVHNPDGDTARFNVLVRGDLALIVFQGDTVPNAADIVFVAQSEVEDQRLHGELSRLVPDGERRSMAAVSPEQLAEAIRESGVSEAHPARLFVSDPSFEEALEDASFGSEAGAQAIRRRRGLRNLSADDLSAARANAERIGSEGEDLVFLHLTRLKLDGLINDVEWTSKRDASSPFDFKLTMPDGSAVKIDAKSTTGSFDRSIHLSAAEVHEAAEAVETYDIYRIYGMNDDGGKLRISRDIRQLGRQIMEWAAGLPAGVRPDSFSVSPLSLQWEPELDIRRPDDPAGEV